MSDFFESTAHTHCAESLSNLVHFQYYCSSIETLQQYILCSFAIVSNNIYYKWKNHFSEMKGDVGMSLHEKEGEQEDA